MEDNNLTVTLKDGWRVPRYLPSVLQQDFGLMDDGKVPVSTAEEQSSWRVKRQWDVYGMLNEVMCLSIYRKDRECVCTCCIAPGQVSICRLMGFWSFWCLHNHLDSSSGSHLTIAGVKIGKTLDPLIYQCTDKDPFSCFIPIRALNTSCHLQYKYSSQWSK